MFYSGKSPSPSPIPWPHLLALLLLPGFPPALHAQEINPPLGPYVHLRPEHFADASTYNPTNRLVTTPYFYWYDKPTGAHLLNADGSDALTDHPASTEDFSYRSVDWHARELSDMEDAGIDVVLPVYWGEPSQRLPGRPITSQPWSYAGIPPLVAARERLLQAGRHPPRIGLFYDTSTLQYNQASTPVDLTTPHGRQWFYESIRDFFSLVPPKHWAMIDHQPIVFLYSASFATDHDQACFEYLAAAFADDFGGHSPWVVREISWNITSPQVYAWGGALGLKNPGVASLGPGYDHSAVPGREPLVVERDAGAFFSSNWNRFLRKPSSMVMIETWNEFHEGTDIAESLEYGREYITLNRHFADIFHQGIIPPPIQGPFSDFSRVSVQLAATNLSAGLLQVESADGLTTATTAAGQPCRVSVPSQHAGRYFYFRIDDSFKWTGQMRVNVGVDYFDTANGSFTLEFDGSDTNAPPNGAYTPTLQHVPLTGTRQWKHASFTLHEARFLNSQNGAADFRLSTTDELYLQRVEVRRFGLPAEAGSKMQAVQDDFSLPSSMWRSTNSTPVEFYRANKMLSVPPGQRCLLRTAPLSGADQGILARVRVAQLPAAGSSCGGLVLGADPGFGLSLTVSIDGPGLAQAVLQNETSGTSQSIPVDWHANAWFWLRLNYQSDTARIVARIWNADGEAVEPIDWPLVLESIPARVVAAGVPGLLGPPTKGPALECDYFLFRNESADEVVVRLPALKPPRAKLHALASSPSPPMLLLSGAPIQTYFIETTVNLLEWTSSPVTTDSSGQAVFQPAHPGPHRRQLYRASHQN